MRSNYWSCSKFADWLRGTAKPGSESSSGWNQWQKKAKSLHPLRYWLAEEGLDRLQNFVNWPAEQFSCWRYYINNRWVSRSHACTAHPRDIKPGSWSDVGNRFLPCLFNELVNFVEVEVAWHHCLWDAAACKKYQVPWWRRGWLRWRAWRSPEAGMAHLIWSASLVDDQGNPSHQATAAKEIIDLYVWWTHIRANRPDAMEASGWAEICDRRKGQHGDILWEDESAEEQKETRIAIDRCQEIEQQYEEEDEAMLIRLIRVRNSLWT